MPKLEKISAIQLISMILINRFLFGFSFMPTVTISPANQDAWVADILSGVMVLLFAIPLLIMASKFPNMGFNEYFQVILGTFIGKVVCFIYSLYLVFITLLTVIFLSDFLLSAVLPETPMYAILLFMLIPCMYASYKGLECIARSSIIISTFIIFSIVLYVMLNFNNMDFEVFHPILLDSTLSQIAFGSFNNAARFSDCFLFFLFLTHVDKTETYTVTKIFIILVVTFTLMNTVLTVATQSVLGVGLAKILRYPYFTSIQQINLFSIIQRIEFFNVIGWIVIFFFKICSTILAAAIIMAQVFKVKSYKPFVIPMNIIIALSVLLTSISHYAIFKTIITDYAYLVIFTMNFIIPTIVLAVYIFRRKALEKYNV